MAAAAAAVLAVSACGNQVSTSGGATAPSARSSASSPAVDGVSNKELIFLFSGTVEHDVKNLPYPAVAARSKLAIAGTIVDVARGRLLAESADDPFATRYSAIAVTATKVAKGEGAAPGDTIWVELEADPTVIVPQLPVDLEVVLFLDPAAESFTGIRFSRADSEIPSDAALWQLAHPQGLVVGSPGRPGFVIPHEDKVVPRGKPGDLLPE
ncbi:hypothetical protein [Nocardioides stalactiti]|uniref:hypothetical protein n=1 Tax=Nocardioides stalactiti TaxID=2755356 RepID=UPI001602967A|nr:hypothetical protein [Nocardioides stalactiti]